MVKQRKILEQKESNRKEILALHNQKYRTLTHHRHSDSAKLSNIMTVTDHEKGSAESCSSPGRNLRAAEYFEAKSDTEIKQMIGEMSDQKRLFTADDQMLLEGIGSKRGST